MTFFHHLDDLAELKPVQGFTGKLIHSENMTVVNWSIESGSAFPEHSHPHEQVSMMLEGEFELTVAGEIKVLQAGLIAIVPSNVPHGGRALSDCRLLDIFHPVREDLR